MKTENDGIAKTPFNLFGVECGKGWHGLVKKVMDRVDEINRKYGFSDDEKIIPMQIKEKWGGLRIYLNYYVDNLDELVSEVENESFKVCEECGSTEHVGRKSNGWFRTLCINCLTKEAMKCHYPIRWMENGTDELYEISVKKLDIKEKDLEN